LDGLFSAALAAGVLQPDQSLVIEEPIDEAALDEALLQQAGDEGAASNGAAPSGAATRTYSLQFDSPDSASIPAAEAAVRQISGVRSAATTSLALGGVSVMRVSFDGDAESLRNALAARGYRVSLSGDTLRIRR
jgi:hypothetical protein